MNGSVFSKARYIYIEWGRFRNIGSHTRTKITPVIPFRPPPFPPPQSPPPTEYFRYLNLSLILYLSLNEWQGLRRQYACNVKVYFLQEILWICRLLKYLSSTVSVKMSYVRLCPTCSQTAYNTELPSKNFQVLAVKLTGNWLLRWPL